MKGRITFLLCADFRYYLYLLQYHYKLSRLPKLFLFHQGQEREDGMGSSTLQYNTKPCCLKEDLHVCRLCLDPMMFPKQ